MIIVNFFFLDLVNDGIDQALLVHHPVREVHDLLRLRPHHLLILQVAPRPGQVLPALHRVNQGSEGRGKHLSAHFRLQFFLFLYFFVVDCISSITHSHVIYYLGFHLFRIYYKF